jgi:hypothetical protein
MMEDRIITVPKLSVEVVTGDTCYPAEGGFSAIFAEVTPDDARIERQLVQAQERKLTITLRCAMLDATGRITTSRSKGKTRTFVLSVEDMTYRKPGRPNTPSQPIAGKPGSG